ncbi:MAG: nucleotidyl transferase AbiEii/AbiGii toxin family protein [Cyclobacteriaceae bacterium]
MLYKQSVNSRLFSVLDRLSVLPCLSSFALAGGTALALKYGHRISIDIDLFGKGDIKEDVVPQLEKSFGKSVEIEDVPGSWAFFGFIDGIKVDIIPYDHPLLNPVEIEGNLRLFSTPDIVAMKINALFGRATKKDFWGLHELLNHYTLDEMITFHQQKFPKQRLMVSVPQALTYFEDAENTPDPVSLKGIEWCQVKREIQKKVSEFLL